MELTRRFDSPAAALRVGVEVVGSQAATARLLGVTQAAVSIWLSEGKALPTGPAGGTNYVLTMERETGISRHELRPDLYPAEERTPTPADHDGARR